MPKNIVLLSDGTGNSSAKLFKTNVWRLYQALDLDDPTQQVAFYDDGVGTSSFKPFAILGGIFGFGLKRNVLAIYKFACRTYEPGDHIFGFGFSRGAFTIRIVAGLIARQGLAPYHEDEAQLARDAADAYRAYRERFNVTGGLVSPLRHLRNRLIQLVRALKRVPLVSPHDLRTIDSIHFMGVWDTVGAYGGPIEEVTRGIDYWLWPLSMPDRFMNAKIRRACHALALDDERNSFWPILWDDLQVSGEHGPQPMMHDWQPPNQQNQSDIDRQRLSQVWFIGMHSDVGGGYPQDGLAYVTLDWMMDRASVYDLRINAAARTEVQRLAEEFDKLNDSRHGLAGYYRYKPRKLIDIYAADVDKPALGRDVARVGRAVKHVFAKQESKPATNEGRPAPMIHESVFRRIKAEVSGYAPIVLPESYRVATRGGAVVTGAYETATQAERRVNGQELAWNWAWARRIVYFLTLFATLGLVGLPLIERRWPGLGAASPAAFIVPAVDLAGRFLPGFVSPWIDAFRSAPEQFVVGAVLVALLLFWGGALQQRVGDVMRKAWCRVVDPTVGDGPPCAAPRDWIFRLRSSQLYRGFFYGLSHWVLPTACAILIVYAAFVMCSRVLFAAGESLGLVCQNSGRNLPEPSGRAEFNLDIRRLCQPSGWRVRSGQPYRITLALSAPWEDGHRQNATGIVTGPNGFGWERTRWTMIAGIPLRRHLSENWLRTILRVGAAGNADQPLSFAQASCRPDAGASVGDICYEAKFTPGINGEAFLFVNDSVIGLPWIAGLFYWNNEGSAKAVIDEVH